MGAAAVRNDSLKVTRQSADKLILETWGFEVTFPSAWRLREGEGPVAITLQSYERAQRDDARKRTFKPVQRLLFGGYFPGSGISGLGGPRRMAWMDVSANAYAWETGDCRRANVTELRPTLPADVEADAYNALRPRVTIAKPDEESK